MDQHPNWRSLCTVSLPWKTFVREGTSVQQKKKAASILSNSLTGDEAKHLYEEIVKSESEQTVKEGSSSLSVSASDNCLKLEHQNDRRRICHVDGKSVTELDKTSWINRIMKAAQDNNVNSVSSLLKETPHFDVNTVDQYGWTVLMCAAGSGALDVVKFLIKNGADTTVEDKSGNCCLSIAKRMKHFDIINYINSGSASEEKQVVNVNASASTFYCDVCKRNFDDEKDKHMTSTVHLFNSHPGGSRTYYAIPESNRGFQILLKAGWDKEKGLGPEGSGHKFPLKTVLRQDRRGIGQPSKLPARVTHFDPFCTTAVRVERKSKVRKERETLRLKERRKERMLRQVLS